MRRLYMAGYLDNCSGYGQLNSSLIQGFLKAGIQVTFFPFGLAEKHGKIPDEVLACVNKTRQPYPEFLIQPPSHKPINNCVRLLLWETTRISADWVKHLNQCLAIITASNWNADCFSAAGVNVPIYKVPLFVPGNYEYSPPTHKPYFVFGCSGNMESQAPRKNLAAAIRAFQKAFPPSVLDVKLNIKIGHRHYVEPTTDPRVSIIKSYLTDTQMREWYRELDVFVHPVKSEGWGFQPLQAMATGRPVIMCKYGAVVEFFDSQVGYELDYTFGPASDMYTNSGHWAIPNEDDLSNKMRWAYEHKEESINLGIAGAKRANQFTLERTIQGIIPILEQNQILLPK